MKRSLQDSPWPLQILLEPAHQNIFTSGYLNGKSMQDHSLGVNLRTNNMQICWKAPLPSVPQSWFKNLKRNVVALYSIFERSWFALEIWQESWVTPTLNCLYQLLSAESLKCPPYMAIVFSKEQYCFWNPGYGTVLPFLGNKRLNFATYNPQDLQACPECSY